MRTRTSHHHTNTILSSVHNNNNNNSEGNNSGIDNNNNGGSLVQPLRRHRQRDEEEEEEEQLNYFQHLDKEEQENLNYLQHLERNQVTTNNNSNQSNTMEITNPPPPPQDRNGLLPPSWNQEAANNAYHQKTPWILTLYCPTVTPPWDGHNNNSNNKNQHNGTEDPAVVIRIHVTPDMTLESWRQCIQHATSQYDTTTTPVAGLFRKRDYGYFSLEHIWATSSITTYNEYWLFLPPHYHGDRQRGSKPHHHHRHRTLWQRLGGIIILLVILAVFVLLAPPFRNWNTMMDVCLSWWSTMAWFQQWVVDACHDSISWFHRVLIHQPIQDFYRHGPTWLGAWEGMPLSQICVRLSLMGDEDFWKRNMDDCRNMYQLKQEAVIRTIQPVIYAGLLYILWSMAKVEYLRRRQYRPDPNMVELYHAFHVLLRQVQRVLTSTTTAPRN